MNYRRLELVGMVALVLVVNLIIGVWWLWDGGFSSASASPSTQEIQTASSIVIPRTFSYQGTLRDASGNLVNGTVKLTLRIYNTVTGGNALHTETFNNVTVRDGVFSIVVGDTTPIASTVFDNYPLYLGISVNQDSELLPRQRLHPVPYAMQASSAQSALTADNLIAGGGVPNAVSLGAGGAKSIGFPDGGLITDSASGMSIRGGGPDKAVSIDGSWSAGAILDHGDSNSGANVRSTYPVNINRYVVEAEDNGASPDTVPIDDALLTELCQDEDGCGVSIYMRDFNDSLQPGLLAGYGPYRFSLAAPANNKRQWIVYESYTGISSTTGEDNDNIVTHILNAYNACYFTDGEYLNNVGSDSQFGFGLLNFHGAYDSTSMTCVLVIED